MRADAASTSRTLAAGDVLDGRYRIVRPIATGGVGTVFLAEHTLIERKLAIELFHGELGLDRASIERIMSVALAAGALGHSNIVQAIESGFTDDRAYIVFEYIEGCGLAHEIRRAGAMSVQRAVDIALQIASALEASHAAGIVHFGLSTESVMLAEHAGLRDRVKVLDYGIARFLPPLLAPFAMGTAEMIAPEQIYAPGWTDHRTDVYALGACLYEMLEGRRPFPICDSRALLDRIVNERPGPFERDVPRELSAAILDRMLAKEPAQRFPMMSDVIDALRAIARVLPERASTSTAVEPVAARNVIVTSYPTHVSAPTRRRRALWWTVAAVAAVSMGSGAGYLYESAQTPVAAAAAATPAAAPPVEQLSQERLLAAVEGAKQRALAIASSPMLRAAIETDGPTVLDLLTTDATFALHPGEVVEVYRGEAQLLARVPVDADALAGPGSAKLDLRSARRVEVTVPVLGRNATTAGSLVLAVPLDETLLDTAARPSDLLGAHGVVVQTN
jgi:hypothetical protein